MRCRMRNARALRCKPDGWLPSWDSLTRLLQTLIVPEWPQSEQPADVSLQDIGFAGRQSDASQKQRQPRICTDLTDQTSAESQKRHSPQRHRGHGEESAKSTGNHGSARISPIAVTFRRGRPVYFLLTCFLSSTPGVNLATLRAAILMTPPVCGLRPLRALRCETENVPKPTRVTRSPFFSASVTASIRVSMAAAALVLVMPVEAATFSTRSPLFMTAPHQVTKSAGNIWLRKAAYVKKNRKC